VVGPEAPPQGLRGPCRSVRPGYGHPCPRLPHRDDQPAVRRPPDPHHLPARRAPTAAEHPTPARETSSDQRDRRLAHSAHIRHVILCPVTRPGNIACRPVGLRHAGPPCDRGEPRPALRRNPGSPRAQLDIPTRNVTTSTNSLRESAYCQNRPTPGQSQGMGCHLWVSTHLIPTLQRRTTLSNE
jgi:hypothetical protein